VQSTKTGGSGTSSLTGSGFESISLGSASCSRRGSFQSRKKRFHEKVGRGGGGKKPHKSLNLIRGPRQRANLSKKKRQTTSRFSPRGRCPGTIGALDQGGGKGRGNSRSEIVRGDGAPRRPEFQCNRVARSVPRARRAREGKNVSVRLRSCRGVLNQKKGYLEDA